jgi:hypothetical protein
VLVHGAWHQGSMHEHRGDDRADGGPAPSFHAIYCPQSQELELLTRFGSIPFITVAVTLPP